MRCACWRAVLPSTIAVCLSMLLAEASAADQFTVPDGDGTWAMTIAPASQEIVVEGESPIQLAAYQEEVVEEGTVPEPLDPFPAAPMPAAAETVEPTAPSVEPTFAAPAIDPAAYWSVYRTIPFLRTEYRANPSYRHDATMEFLFGQLRPTVVHKHQQTLPSAPVVRPALIPPYVYDVHRGTIPTFFGRYRLPLIPFRTYAPY